jgi:UPF0755 protein
VNDGPPPVPGGRSPEEREAARQQRAARRVQRTSTQVVAPPKEAREPPDWPTDRDRSDGADPRRPRRRGMRWLGLGLALVALVALAAGAWFMLSLFQPFHGDGGDRRVSVVVPRGSTLGAIADLLEERGVIRSAGFFELRARIAGRADSLKPGRYRLREDSSYIVALDELEKGVPPNVVQITIPEGRSRREVAPLVDKLPGNYLRATRRSPALDPSEYGAEGARSLEGFLFPASYELKKGQSVRRLVDEQLTAFKGNFEKVDLRYARRRNLTPYDVLVIASLVEREAALPRERPLISSVIYNRLRQNIRLDIDATTRFAVGNWTEPLKQSELDDPSPYNTRVYPGLPPGPIGSPGLDSIEAAAGPARSRYLFYVVKPGTCGAHNFSDTYAEFEADKATYDRARAERGGKSPTTC